MKLTPARKDERKGRIGNEGGEKEGEEEREREREGGMKRRILGHCGLIAVIVSACLALEAWR